MTEIVPSEEGTPAALTLDVLVGKLYGNLGHLDPGELARLRRAQGKEYASATLWRLLTSASMQEGPYTSQKFERVWAVLLANMAQGFVPSKRGAQGDAFGQGHSLGAALAEAGVSELRLSRLLDASPTDEHGDFEGRIPLHEELRRTLAILVSKGVPIQWGEVAKLLFYAEAPAEACRRRIARDYFRHEHKNNQ